MRDAASGQEERLIAYIGFAQPDEWHHWAGTYARHSQRFEGASGGLPCLVIPFYHTTPELMRRLEPEAVVLSGFARSFEDYEVASFYGVSDWLDAMRIPTLALCGSHQLLGFHFNRSLRDTESLSDQPMRLLRPGEPVTNPDYHPEHFMERGFYTLELTDEGRVDPLFSFASSAPVIYESHYAEIKTLPPGYDLLASTPECRIQAMKCRAQPIYSVQFHPEDYSERFPDGKALLENFFRFAREYSTEE
jgi:GMP synthase-like glutamine amidotransferase